MSEEENQEAHDVINECLRVLGERLTIIEHVINNITDRLEKLEDR